MARPESGPLQKGARDSRQALPRVKPIEKGQDPTATLYEYKAKLLRELRAVNELIAEFKESKKPPQS